MAAPFVRHETPQISWSASRMAGLDYCAREYRLLYVDAHNGDLFDAPHDARQAWLYKRLVSLEMATVQSLRTRARRIARAVVRGDALPSLRQVLHEAQRDDFGSLLEETAASYFTPGQNPRPSLMERIYGMPWPAEQKAAFWASYTRRAAALLRLPVWAALARNREAIRLGPLQETQAVRQIQGVQVYATPTLWWRDRDADVVQVLQIRGGERERDDLAQQAIDVFAAASVFDVAPSAVRLQYVGLEAAANLDAARAAGMTVYHMGPHPLIVGSSTLFGAAVQRIAEDVARLATLHGPALHAREVGDQSALDALFPKTANRQRCGDCRLREICWPAGLQLTGDTTAAAATVPSAEVDGRGVA